jgi:hypothetical protein
MKQISISEATTEMVLAKDVYGRNDNLLIGEGNVLNAEHIECLTRFGVETLWIEASDEGKTADSEKIEKVTQEVETLLESQFQNVSHNPVMQELKNIFARYLIEKRTT